MPPAGRYQNRSARTVGNTLLKFRSKSEDTAEIVGELLGALMR